MNSERTRTLPSNLPPRLLSREQAAEYCGGISTPHFIETIGQEVPPIEIGKRKFWDVRALDHYLDIQSGLIETPLPSVADLLPTLGLKSKARNRR
jgi:hypothetical protein